MHIDYYVSLNSPWTHLGAARIEAMAMANNAQHAHLSGRLRRYFRQVGWPAFAATFPAAPSLPAAGTCPLA